jgi:hypothetical protein
MVSIKMPSEFLSEESAAAVPPMDGSESCCVRQEKSEHAGLPGCLKTSLSMASVAQEGVFLCGARSIHLGDCPDEGGVPVDIVA